MKHKRLTKNFKMILVLIVSALLIMSPVTLANTSTTTSSDFQKATVIPLNFVPADTFLNPSEPILYFTSIAEKKVYSLNYETQVLKSLDLDLAPEHMAYYNNQLYVTMTYGHQYYTSSINGYIAIIDPDTLTLKDTLPVDIDPYDLVVDHNGYIYVFPGSGQWGKVLSYDPVSKNKIAECNNVYQQYLSEIDPVKNTIISVDQGLSPLDLFYFDVSQGSFVKYADSPYHGDYPLVSWFRISQDGKFVFNSSGDVFNDRLQHVTKLNNGFSDIAFDPDHNRFFTGENPKLVVAYDYNNGIADESNRFKATGSFYTLGNISKLFYQNNRIMSLSTLAQNQYFLEIYAMPSQGLPVTNPSASLEDNWTSNKAMPNISPIKGLSLGFKPMDSLVDPNQTVIYMTDSNTNSVYALNYETGSLSEVQFNNKPERLALYNDELYVTLTYGHNYWTGKPDSGAIGIIDTKSFAYKDRINVDTDPYDVVVDHEGYIYVLPGSNQWVPIVAYSRVTKQKLGASTSFRAWSFAEIDPQDNAFFTVDTDSSPRDMQKFTVSQGKFLNNFDSPYHGDYPMATKFRVSPDGRYIFNGSGEIFDSILSHVSKISAFSDIAFDNVNNIFFTGSKDGVITVYDFDNNNLGRVFHALGTFNIKQTIDSIFYLNNSLIVFSDNNLIVYKIGPGVPITTGNAMDAPVDENAPFGLNGIFPFPNSSDLPINTPIVLMFNHNLNTGDFSNISLSDPAGKNIPIITKAVENGVVIIPQTDLDFGNNYIVSIPAKTINDSNNVLYDKEITSSFQTGNEFNRLGGQDRIETSIKISQEGWPSSDVVVLATGEDFPDAMTAAPLAKKYNAPILLTSLKQLSNEIVAEIDRLQASTIVIIGGYGAVSADVENWLKDQKGLNCERISGNDRYETSLNIAQYLDANGTVFIATGKDFPDALSIASYAASNEIPILLTETEGLSAEALEYIKTTGTDKSYVIGGTGVLSPKIEAQVPNPERIAGIDRYETNYKVLSKFGFNFTYTFLATGQNFPDALAGSALAAQVKAPIVLISGQELKNELPWNMLQDKMKMKYILGAEGVMPSNKLLPLFK